MKNKNDITSENIQGNLYKAFDQQADIKQNLDEILQGIKDMYETGLISEERFENVLKQITDVRRSGEKIKKHISNLVVKDSRSDNAPAPDPST